MSMPYSTYITPRALGIVAHAICDTFDHWEPILLAMAKGNKENKTNVKFSIPTTSVYGREFLTIGKLV